MQILSSIERMFEGFSAGTITGKILIAFGSILTAIYSPIAALLISCFIFTIIDMVYGIKVAHKLHLKITSDKNWNGTLTKLVDEFIIISLARILEWSTFDAAGVHVLTGGTAIIVGLTELWSILENLNTLNPKGPWRALGVFLKKKGEDYTGITLNLNENDKYDSNNPEMDSKQS